MIDREEGDFRGKIGTSICYHDRTGVTALARQVSHAGLARLRGNDGVRLFLVEDIETEIKTRETKDHGSLLQIDVCKLTKDSNKRLQLCRMSYRMNLLLKQGSLERLLARKFNFSSDLQFSTS